MKPPSADPRPRSGWAPVLLLIVAVALVYWPVLGFEFTAWDDVGTVALNPDFNPPTVHSVLSYWSKPYMELYIPVTYTLWGLLAWLGQVSTGDGGTTLNPYLFHAANLLLHTLSALTVWALLQRLTSTWPAAVGALIFAIHPVQVETVAWVSGAKDLLAGLLGLCALWQFVTWRQEGGKHHYLLATGALVLALLSKPSTVVVPALAMVLDVAMLGQTPRRSARALWPWLVFGLATALIARLVQPAPEVFSPLKGRAIVALDAIGFYVRTILWPAALGIDYGRRPEVVLLCGIKVLGSIGVLLIGGIAAWRFRRNRRALGILLLFLFAIAPVLGLVPFEFQVFSTVADHYLYLPMIAPAAAVAFLCTSAHPQRRRILTAAAIAWALALSVVAWRQTWHWQDSHALFTRALEVNRYSWVAHVNMASILQHDPPAAREHAMQAIAIRPDDPTRSAYVALAAALQAEGNVLAAEQAYNDALEAHPDNVLALSNLAGLLARQGRWDESIRRYEEALAILPQFIPAQDGLRAARQRAGK